MCQLLMVLGIPDFKKYKIDRENNFRFSFFFFFFFIDLALYYSDILKMSKISFVSITLFK